MIDQASNKLRIKLEVNSKSWEWTRAFLYLVDMFATEPHVEGQGISIIMSRHHNSGRCNFCAVYVILSYGALIETGEYYCSSRSVFILKYPFSSPINLPT
jgi:hypothetical protein